VIAVKIAIFGFAIAAIVCGWIVTLAKAASRRDRR